MARNLLASIALLLLAWSCQARGAAPAPLASLPPAPRGAAQCPTTPGQDALLSALARADVHLNQSAHSVAEAVLRDRAVACWFRTEGGDAFSGVGIFEAAFFPDTSSASAFTDCRPLSGSGIFWLRAGNVVLWTKDAALRDRLQRALGADHLSC